MVVAFCLAFWAVGIVTCAWVVYACKHHRPEGQLPPPPGTPPKRKQP